MAAIFLELLRERPPDSWTYLDREPLRLEQGYAFPLGNAACKMPKAVRARFPLLARVDLHSVYYGPQELLLSPAEAVALCEEFARVKEVYEYRDFEPGMDSETFRRYWRGHETEEDFERQMNEIVRLLKRAVEEAAWLAVST